MPEETTPLPFDVTAPASPDAPDKEVAPPFAPDVPTPDAMATPPPPVEPLPATTPPPVADLSEPKYLPITVDDTIEVNAAGLYKVLVALMKDSDAYSGAGARRAFAALFPEMSDEKRRAKWEEVKSYFPGGENYAAIR